MTRKEVCPRDEVADPPGTTVLPIDRHGFAKGFASSFCTLCGAQSSLVRFASNRAIVWGPPQCNGRHRKRLCVSGLRSPELSAQVKGPNSSTSYRQGYGEGVSMPPRPKV